MTVASFHSTTEVNTSLKDREIRGRNHSKCVHVIKYLDFFFLRISVQIIMFLNTCARENKEIVNAVCDKVP